MKILFIGCVYSSHRFLESIYTNTTAEVVGVVTKKNSDYNADHVSLIPFCKENKIPYIDYKNSIQLLSWVKEKNPDIIYCFGWSYLLPKEILDYPKLGSVGYHPTLLPRNRGRHPIIWSIILGLKKTGSSFFYLTEEPDDGDLVSQEIILLDENETAKSLYEKLLYIGQKQVIDLTNNIMNKTICPIKQDKEKATYWRKRNKADGQIDWRMSGQDIVRLVNALVRPYPGAHFIHEKKEVIIWKMKFIKTDEFLDVEKGKIIKVSHDSFNVTVGEGYVEIIEFDGDFVPEEGVYL